MEYEPTILGEKKGSIKQYRHGKLHIREYDDYYSVHYDKIDPHKDAFGHILVDASKYIPGIMMLSVISNYLITSDKWKRMIADLPSFGVLVSKSSDVGILMITLSRVVR